MTALGKRILETVLIRDKDDGASTDVPLAKRPRCEPAPGTAEIAVGDTWNGIKCNKEDIKRCGDIVRAAQTGRGLVMALEEASLHQIDLALIQLFDDCAALARLCCAIVPTLPQARPAFPAANSEPDESEHHMTIDALLCRAAQQGRRAALAVLVRHLADEYDVARAVEMADEEDDPTAIELILDTYADDTGEDTTGSYRRIAYVALTCAVHSSRVALIHRYADECDAEDVHGLLDDCLEDADVFAALWKHAVLCAHNYAASLPPCPALDHLTLQIANGEPCADLCASYEPADSDDDTDDDDTDDDTDDNDDDGDGDEDDDDNDTDQGKHEQTR
ncbi:hypothetical protein pqer_cds_475 [Pandoravirus quercus]|uniref:Uncharacterized protein n=2 Tax=Pandoravirus TaxID=2060084 RepID=A0A2U7U8X8_9VIRU|nr:hypothetical protein pqer_cds_475 [Pandoravirus quercus]AVK74897.1 hypothetical protein pqer_cds_475 [Pandoravirus quercus]QBZ81083.1 hypothetical protein pclt_cds_489 [Pandoravirus celtis]